MSDAWAYERDGRLWPRLTRVLDIIKSPGLDDWRRRVGGDEADRVATKAAKIGTAVHRAIMAALQGRKPPKLTGERLRAFEAWQRWHAAQMGFVPSRLETTMFGQPPFNFAGTPDCIEDGAVGGVCRVTEWKVTGSIETGHWIQAAAQAALAWPGMVAEYIREPMTMDNGIALRVVRIDPFLGMVEERERAFDPRVLATFMHLVEVYRDWYFAPRLQAEMEKFELIAAKSGGHDDEALVAIGDDDDGA